MEDIMKESILMIKNMGTEYINGLMGKYTRVGGLRVIRMERGNINIKMVILNIVYMIRVRG
jgi:hypothetical protein